VLLDFMRIAALTGARLESIAQLTVGACHGKVFFIKQDKSKAGTRRVPIHSELQPLVDRRCRGRAAADWLFPELSTRASGSRSAAISTRFNRYRMDLEIDEKRPDRRGSLVNFHSFRHWFITAALRARQPEAVVDQVIGHASKSLARRVYFDGDLEAALRGCVESVKLPTEPSRAAAEASPVLVDADQPALA
jgi:integrase